MKKYIIMILVSKIHSVGLNLYDPIYILIKRGAGGTDIIKSWNPRGHQIKLMITTYQSSLQIS